MHKQFTTVSFLCPSSQLISHIVSVSVFSTSSFSFSPYPDLKALYFQAGVENKPTVFLFNDIQAVEEGFFEDINNILSSGEVPNLYKGEEFEEVKIPQK